MKFLVSILMMIAICVQALPAESQAALEETTQTSKESDEWARKIDNIIKLYAAEEPRRPVRLEEVKDYSLEELFKIALQFHETTIYGEEELILQHYMEKARKANATRHVKLAHIFMIIKKANFRDQDILAQYLQQYSEDKDLFVAFTASNFQVQIAGAQARPNLSNYRELLNSYSRLRTLIPSSSHIDYEYYRFRDALVSELLMVRGNKIVAVDQAQKEIKYFAQKLGVESSYYDTAHNLIVIHASIFADENSIMLAGRLSDAAQNDKERSLYSLYILGYMLLDKKEFKRVISEFQKRPNLRNGYYAKAYFGILSKAYRYTGDLEKAEISLENTYKLANGTQDEIVNSRPMRELTFLKKINLDGRPDAIEFLIEQDIATAETYSKAWELLTQSYIHSLGDSRQVEEAYQGGLSDVSSKTLSPAIKERMNQVLNIYKTPNLLTVNQESNKSLNLFTSIKNRAENAPNTATHYLQNSDFYKTLLTHDYSQSLIFQTTNYSNILPPKTTPESYKTQAERLQIDLFNALHYVYMNDTKMAWKAVAEINAEIVISESSLAELDYQVEYLKFLLFTKERNLFLATIAANNHVVRAIELKRPVDESSILENLLYLMYQNNYYDEALIFLDDAPTPVKANQYATKNIEYLKALLLTQTGQHAAALAHAQIHNGDENSDEQETLFESLKYLNQAAMGDVENAKITKQMILNRLSRISNTTIQNMAHLNMARAQTHLRTENVGVYKDKINTLATALERSKNIEIVKLRAQRDQANLQEGVRVREHLNTLAGTIEENQLNRNFAYFLSTLLALFLAALGVLHFKRKQSFDRKTTSFEKTLKEAEKIYQYLRFTSNERVNAMRRIIHSVKDTHIDEATIHSLSVAIDEADALLGDIKRTKIRSRLARPLDGATISMFDPHKFRSTMVPIWMQKIKSKNVTFTFNCDANLGPFETDAEILIAAIEETVMKAINATLFGSIIVEFNVSKKLSKHLLSINITDTGNASQSFNADDVAPQAIAALNGSLNHSCEAGIGCNVKITLPIKLSNPRIKTPQNNNVVNFKN